MSRVDHWCAICSRWTNHITSAHDVFDVLAGEMSVEEAAALADPTEGGGGRG